MQGTGATPEWLQQVAVPLSTDETFARVLVELESEVLRGDGAEAADSSRGSFTVPGQAAQAEVRATVVDAELVIEVANVAPTGRPWLVVQGVEPVPLEYFEGSLQATIPLDVVRDLTALGVLWPT